MPNLVKEKGVVYVQTNAGMCTFSKGDLKCFLVCMSCGVCVCACSPCMQSTIEVGREVVDSAVAVLLQTLAKAVVPLQLGRHT